MRKLYSLVLIAAGLLIGTNSWAAFQIGSTTYGSLNEAVGAANDGDEIKVTSPSLIAEKVTLNANKHVVLNLGAFDLEVTYAGVASKDAAIEVKQGVLEITGVEGTISSDQAKIYDLIRLYGTSNAVDAKTGTPYSQVIIGAGVTIQNDKFNALTITQNADKLANGARIDVYGNLNAQKYGIKVNGGVKDPQGEARTYSPFVYVHAGAVVATLDNSTNAVAAYSSGYARWLIEGTCTGATGLYVRSGNVELVNATIASSATYDDPAPGKKSGVEAGGSAIVVESNNKYQGGIQVTIAGNTTVTAQSGYAIEETVPVSSDNTEVENIIIESGTITGGVGAIIVSQKTVENPESDVTIYGGTITATDTEGETVKVGNEGSIADLLPEGADASAYTTTGNTIIVSAGYHVTLNAAGLATFSAEETTKIPAGLKVYQAGAMSSGELNLVLVSNADNYIPANTGVILYGTPGQSYSMLISESGTTTTDYSNNTLYAYTEWASRTSEPVYILHGNELWQYTGTNFPANKAFLQLPANAGAPARISMRFNETQAVENVAPEAVKAVKFVGEDGKLYIRRGEAVYTVQGQLVK